MKKTKSTPLVFTESKRNKKEVGRLTVEDFEGRAHPDNLNEKRGQRATVLHDHSGQTLRLIEQQEVQS